MVWMGKSQYEIIYNVGVHILVRSNTWASPLAGPWTGSSNRQAGPHGARVSWANLPTSWVGPGRADIFDELMGRTGPGRYK